MRSALSICLFVIISTFPPRKTVPAGHQPEIPPAKSCSAESLPSHHLPSEGPFAQPWSAEGLSAKSLPSHHLPAETPPPEGPFAQPWTADPSKAKVLFTVKGPFPFGTVHGNFSGLKATIRFDEKDLPGSAVSASIDAKTVSTGIGLRNSDLRNKEEWLNTDKYPLISFKSSKIEKASKDYQAVGELTLKGTTRPVEIPFSFTASGNTGMFKGRFTINREDYKVGKPGGSVGSTITIELEVPVSK